MAWPTRADGTNKTVGEMTQAERREVFTASTQRLSAEFQRPEVQAGFAAVLASDPRRPN